MKDRRLNIFGIALLIASVICWTLVFTLLVDKEDTVPSDQEQLEETMGYGVQ